MKRSFNRISWKMALRLNCSYFTVGIVIVKLENSLQTELVSSLACYFQYSLAQLTYKF